MATQRIDLDVGTRSAGRAECRKLRRERRVPAVIYGSGSSVSVFVEESQILKHNLIRAENALLNFKSAEKDINNKLALVKEITINPLTRRPEHIDFLALDVKKPVRVSVEVKFEGKPIGLAEGGLLTIVNRQIEVECLPLEIPETFTVDVSKLGVGDSLHISAIQVPKGVKILDAGSQTLAVVNLAEEEVAAVPAAADATAAAPAAGDGKATAPAAGAKAGDAKAAAPAAGKAAPAAGKAPAGKK